MNLRKLLLLLFVTLSLLLPSCKDNGTGPEPKKSVREYTWSADTLYYEGSSQTLMRSIWGSSASDLYIAGHNSGSDGSLWHYNGTAWSDVKLFNYISRSPYGLTAVHGTSSLDVWAAGYRLTGDNPNPPPQYFYQSMILHYDGGKWIEQNVKTKSPVYSIYANSTNDVWACGEDGIVYHYDGNSWSIDTIKIRLTVNGSFQLRSIVSYNEKKYMLAAKIEEFGGKQTDYFYILANGQWVLQDSVTTSDSPILKWGNKLYVTSFDKLYSYGYGGLYELSGKEWQKVFSSQRAITGIFGNNENDIVVTTSYSKGFHYDGKNWEEIEKLKNENILYTGVWMDDDEASVMGVTSGAFPQKTVILHGK